MKIHSIAVFAALCGVGVVAHAAPAAPGISPEKPGNVPITRQAAVFESGVKVLASHMICGQIMGANVQLTNNSKTAQMLGKIVVTVGAETKTELFKIDPTDSKMVHVPVTTTLNCQGPLGLPKVEIFKGPDKIESKTYSPTVYTAAYNNGNATPGVWVRRMTLNGTCGGAATGEADLFTTHPTQTAQFDANFGGNPAYKPVQVVPMVPSTVTIQSPNVDCQGPTGIPVLHFFLQNPAAPAQPTGQLGAYSVVFQPG